MGAHSVLVYQMSHISKARISKHGWRPVRLHVYRRDVVVDWAPKTKAAGGGGPRGELREWSRDSRKRLMFYAANTEIKFQTMLTLTYPNVESDGREVKKHLNHFLTRLRQKYSPVSYLWFLEWQKRGAPHYHVLTSCYVEHHWLASVWYAIVDSGNPDHLKAGTRAEALREEEGGKRYAVKYAAKMYQKEVPDGYRNVGRMWGCSRDVKPRPPVTITVEQYDLLRWMLSGWKYAPMLDEVPLSLLYGAADELREFLMLDKQTSTNP